MQCDVYSIWTTYSDGLKSYISKRISDKDDVDDILQTVLIKLTNYCQTKNDIQNIKGWIYKIAHNVVIDFYKTSSKNVKTPLENLSNEGHHDYDENIFVWLHNFIDHLPDSYATPLRLSALEQIPQKQVAERLKLTLEATKSRIQRARKMLRQKFDECGIIETSENQTLSYTITKSCCLK